MTNSKDTDPTPETTAEGWLERSPEEAALNQRPRDLLASIDRTLTALERMKKQERQRHE